MGSYKNSSLILYKALTGDTDADRQVNTGSKTYLTFKDNQLSPATGTVQFVQDPFGYSYGYSTINSTTPGSGYNPTFDLWSTSASTVATGQAAWVKNW